MVKRRKRQVEELQETASSAPAPVCGERPRSLEIAAAGVRTSDQFAMLMSAIMSDVIEGKMAPNVAQAAVNAGGKLLKVVEMQQKFGRQDGASKTLLLTNDQSNGCQE